MALLRAMNSLLLVGTLLIVLEFGSSERLASAYGLAVSGAMVITAVLFFQVVSQESGAKRWLRWLLISGFLAIDLIFSGRICSKSPTEAGCRY
jgi:KUP system potassium uptake protein